MKKFIAITLVLALVILSACTAEQILPKPQTQQQAPAEQQQTPTQQSQPQQQTITKEHAIELALKAAGVDKAAAFDIEAELDVERGGKFWEVDFETREHEYSYDINAFDGTVRQAERERND